MSEPASKSGLVPPNSAKNEGRLIVPSPMDRFFDPGQGASTVRAHRLEAGAPARAKMAVPSEAVAGPEAIDQTSPDVVRIEPRPVAAVLAVPVLAAEPTILSPAFQRLSPRQEAQRVRRAVDVTQRPSQIVPSEIASTPGTTTRPSEGLSTASAVVTAGSDLVPVPPSTDNLLSREDAGRSLYEFDDESFARDKTETRPAEPDVAKLFPKKQSGFSRFDLILFVVFFLVPVIGGGLYLFLVASNQYVSEFRFNVVDTSSQSSPLTSGLSSMLGGGGLGATSSENYTVVDYITSQQAVHDVGNKLPLRDYFTTSRADWWARLKPSASDEQFLSYWQSMVQSDYDPVTGIATARVRAFDPKIAHRISQTLLESAEALVNNMQTRRYADSVRFAQIEVDRAEAKVDDLRKKMLSLRDQSNVIDPSNSSVSQNIQLVTSQRLILAQQEAQLATIRAATPRSPQIPLLVQQIKGTNEQITKLDREIGTKGGSRQLSNVVGQFEELTAKQALALQELTGDLTNLIAARASADAQHIYLTSYVSPTMPSSSVYPNRGAALALLILICFGTFSLAKLMTLVIRSHAV